MTLVVACGKSAPKVYHHSTEFLHQVQNTHIPKSQLLTALPSIPGYDAVDTNSLPSNAQAVGCYAGPGIYNCTAAHNRAPNAKLISIAQQASVPAKCLDSEPGDASPSQALGWVKWMISRGQYRPCVYASLSMMSQVRANLSSLPRSSYLLWVAAWDNNPTIPAGYDGKQWFGNTHCCYDRDSFLPIFFGPPKPPVPLCSRTMCYNRFSNIIWKNPKVGVCHFGCTERGYMYRWEHDIHKSHSTKLSDRYRLQKLQVHLESVIHHSSKATNKKYNRYDRAHILWVAGFQAEWFSNYNGYRKAK